MKKNLREIYKQTNERTHKTKWLKSTSKIKSNQLKWNRNGYAYRLVRPVLVSFSFEHVPLHYLPIGEKRLKKSGGSKKMLLLFQNFLDVCMCVKHYGYWVCLCMCVCVSVSVCGFFFHFFFCRLNCLRFLLIFTRNWNECVCEYKHVCSR